MIEIYILFIILGTLYIIENKSINLLAYYVGMVIIIAILISIYPDIYNIEQYWSGISYISYMLVLVQISALTILFGFIIMLYPKNNTDILIKEKNLNKIIIPGTPQPMGLWRKRDEGKKYISYILLIISISILYFIIINLPILNMLNNILYYLTEDRLTFSEIKDIKNIENNTSIFIKKISYLLYSEPTNILKFMVIAIVLLFAIICLFFILSPTI